MALPKTLRFATYTGFAISIIELLILGSTSPGYTQIDKEYDSNKAKERQEHRNCLRYYEMAQYAKKMGVNSYLIDKSRVYNVFRQDMKNNNYTCNWRYEGPFNKEFKACYNKCTKLIKREGDDLYLYIKRHYDGAVIKYHLATDKSLLYYDDFNDKWRSD